MKNTISIDSSLPLPKSGHFDLDECKNESLREKLIGHFEIYHYENGKLVHWLMIIRLNNLLLEINYT